MNNPKNEEYHNDTAPTVGRSIERLLRPSSIVIVGASEKPGALGTSVLANLERAQFSGPIHLINPRRAEIGGRPCLSSIEALPTGVDVAVLAIPGTTVLEAIRSLATRGVGAAIIFAAGFAEGGEKGRAEQHEIARIAREAGMVLLGPNCLGLINYINRIPLTFVVNNSAPLGARPGIGIVSQSGAMAAVLSTTIESRDLGLSFSIATGNEAESGVEDYIEYLIDEPSTRVVAMIVEQFREPRRFLAAARRAQAAGKTLVLLHPGKSSAARESAATHTGAMAGDHQVMRVYVERAGVILAETLEELGDISEIALRCPPLPAHGGIAVLGESGAFKALTLDLCEAMELPLPIIDDSNAPAVRAALPDFVSVSNPLDLTAQALVDPDLYYRTLAALIPDLRFNSIVIGIIQTNTATIGIKIPPLLHAMEDMKPSKPVIFAGLDEGASFDAQYVTDLRAMGIPYFPSTERAFRAIKRLSDHARRNIPAERSVRSTITLPRLQGVIPEYRAKEVLASLGIPFLPGRMVKTLDDAISAAEAIGYPVAIKAQSVALSHKSDAGGVLLDLGDAAALTAGWQTLHANVAAHSSDLVMDGVLVERMGRHGVELIIGARNDPNWGPVILVGFGGVQAELLQDVRLLPPDLETDEILCELNRLKCAAMLTGFRGAPPLDIQAVVYMVLMLGQMLHANESIREIDLNPVVVYPAGEGAVALDALIRADTI